MMIYEINLNNKILSFILSTIQDQDSIKASFIFFFVFFLPFVIYMKALYEDILSPIFFLFLDLEMPISLVFYTMESNSKMFYNSCKHNIKTLVLITIN